MIQEKHKNSNNYEERKNSINWEGFNILLSANVK